MTFVRWVFVVADLLSAGAVGVVVLCGWMWWRKDRTDRAALWVWLVATSVDLTLLVGAVTVGQPHNEGLFEHLVFARSTLVAVTLTLMLAALAALSPSRTIGVGVGVVAALAVGHVVLWQTTNVIYAHQLDSHGWPVYGSAAHVLQLASIAIIFGYASRAVLQARGRMRLGGLLVEVATIAMIIVAEIASTGPVAEGLSSLWMVPTAGLLAGFLAQRIRETTRLMEALRADRAAALDELRQRSSQDPLTGLPNRIAITEHLDREIRGSIGKSHRAAVVMCNLHDLHRVSDVEGHAVADEVVARFARALNTMNVPDTIVGQFGSQNFVVVTRWSDDVDESDFAVFMTHKVFNARVEAGTPGSVAVPMGIAAAQQTSSADGLIRDAGAALTVAIERGVDCQVYEAALGTALRSRNQLERQLRGAVERGEIEVYYQPVVDPVTGDRLAAEALVRWVRDGVARLPSEWIALAEESSLIRQVGMHVLRTACRDQAALGCPVSVNVSPAQLRVPGFAADVVAALRGCAPENVILEITESSIMADLARVRIMLVELRRRGIRVALDDFGTKYSSLSVLASLPFDVLKIDQAFIRSITEPEGYAVVTSINSLAHSLGKVTVAEGVETPAQLEAVAAAGCDRVQGFLTGHPLPLAALLGTNAASAAVR